jgi:hemin uptake protein HemP
MPSNENNMIFDCEATDSEPKTHNAIDLLGTASVAKIELDGQIYILRKTRQNKLILTK